MKLFNLKLSVIVISALFASLILTGTTKAAVAEKPLTAAFWDGACINMCTYQEIAVGNLISAGAEMTKTSGGHFKLYSGNSLIGEGDDGTANDTGANLYLCLWAGTSIYGLSGAGSTFDNVFLANYTANESTFGTWGNVETYYPSDNPTVLPTATTSLSFNELYGFTETATKNGGEIKYQISNDQGTTWYWHNNDWATTSAGYAEASTASEINNNISSFPTGISGQFLFKAYFHSDGTQLVQLDNINAFGTLITSFAVGTYFPPPSNLQPTSILPEEQPSSLPDSSAFLPFSTTSENTAPLTSNENLGIPSNYSFGANLKYDQQVNDVIYLQKFLKSQGTEVYPEGIVSGWFGPLTKKAVIRFQEKYAEDILAFWHLTAGTGFVGQTTRAKINALLGQ